METRRVVIHAARSVDDEKLIVVSVYEPGINKQQIKLENRYSKKHEVLVSNGESYRYKS